MVAEGRTPVVEERIGELIAEVVASGALRATADVAEAVAGSDVALDLRRHPVRRRRRPLHRSTSSASAEQIGDALRERDGRYTVVFRSTMLPGHLRGRADSRSSRSASGLAAGERLRPGGQPGVPARGHVGARTSTTRRRRWSASYDQASGDVVGGALRGPAGPVFRVPVRVAEMTKYVDNAFHALKVGFANEIGALCQRPRASTATRSMDIFCADTQAQHLARLPAARLRVRRLVPAEGPARPAARGPARPTSTCRSSTGILPSNERQVDRAFDAGRAHRQAGGSAARPGLQGRHRRPAREPAGGARRAAARQGLRPADLRPRGRPLAACIGANRAYIEARIPHLERLLACSAPRRSWRTPRTCVVGAAPPRGGRRARRRRRPRRSSTSCGFPGREALRGATGVRRRRAGSRPCRILVLVENLSVPFDRRVWQECRALRRGRLRRRA